ncbi:hypothetical protein [Peribacillus sp. Bi134]|uniref:hypothetical protein n=1 Tax=Peribacillus sp. Bi134 TaxID=2884272 RepID=UPI001D2CD8EB|nr:hypothetical protein [Peribacillus sp. Bi134]CAH0298737.1 hypothetical protein SRABI134_04570 [Peribacillus sp. Bi134]
MQKNPGKDYLDKIAAENYLKGYAHGYKEGHDEGYLKGVTHTIEQIKREAHELFKKDGKN